MLGLISVILIAGSIFCAQPLTDNISENHETGILPEVVITEPRYAGEDIAYSGMLPEIVVTAPRGPEVGMLDEIVITEPRYEGEDIAYSGMLPATVVIAKRLKITVPLFTLAYQENSEMSVQNASWVIFDKIESRNIGYLY